MFKFAEIQNLRMRLNTENGHTIDDNYLELRFEQSVLWYIRRAKLLKFLYYFLSVVGIIIPATIPIINFYSFDNSTNTSLIVNCLSFITSISVAFLSLFKAKEKWIHFRCVAELLQAELSLYAEGVGQYRDAKKRNQRFAVKIERIMASENKQWKGIVSEKNNKDKRQRIR